jgi:L-alanine-DL-glutamate epimerase-like enolase superfamily enzyme
MSPLFKFPWSEAVSLEKPSLADYRREVTVERVEILPVRYPTVMPFRFFESPVFGSGRPAVFVKLTASDGTMGWGQSVPSPRWGGEPLESACFTLEYYLKPVVLGKNPFDIEDIHRAMDTEVPDAAYTALAITKAGIDLALHDLAGRIAGRNVAELWGRPKGQPVELSWTVCPADPADADNWVALGREDGYRHFNIKVAPDLEKDRKLCRIVRALAPEGFLWADANCGYDEATALRAVVALAEDGAAVLEQPLRPHCITGYQRVHAAAKLPIVMDEGLVSPEQLREYLVLGCCDGAAMKPARCGGLLSARRQVEMLREGGHLFLGSGLSDPDVSLAASLILYGAYNLDRPAALNGPQFLGLSMLKTPLLPVDGFLTAPDGPGLGVEVDEDAVRAHCCPPYWK